MPDDGNRYEAIEGDLYMTPSPSLRHQLVSWRLCSALDRFLVKTGHGVVLSAPFGVEFPATSEGVQPDILFVSRDRYEIVAESVVVGAPDLVAEILSPSTASRDCGIKRRLYERQGVQEHWVVDPNESVVDVWRFAEESAHERFTGTLPVRLGTDQVGEIDLKAVFSPDF